MIEFICFCEQEIKFQKMFYSKNCSSDLKIFANDRPSVSNLKSFSRSLEQFFFFTIGQFWKQNSRLTFLLQTEPGRKKVNPFKFGLPKDQQVSSTDKNLIKILESVPGLGEKKSRHLLEHLPSLQQIVQADQGTILFLLILRNFSSSQR